MWPIFSFYFTNSCTPLSLHIPGLAWKDWKPMEFAALLTYSQLRFQAFLVAFQLTIGCEKWCVNFTKTKQSGCFFRPLSLTKHFHQQNFWMFFCFLHFPENTHFLRTLETDLLYFNAEVTNLLQKGQVFNYSALNRLTGVAFVWLEWKPTPTPSVLK